MKKIMGIIFLLSVVSTLVFINTFTNINSKNDNLNSRATGLKNEINLNTEMKNALINETYINMTIEQIISSQSYIKQENEANFITSFPIHQEAYLIPQIDSNKVSSYVLDQNTKNMTVTNLHEFNITAPNFHEFVTIKNQTYQIRPMNWRFYRGNVKDANNSNVVISVLDNVPMVISGRAEYSGFNNTGDFINRIIVFSYNGIPREIQSSSTKLLSTRNIFKQIGYLQENDTSISHSLIKENSSLLNNQRTDLLKTTTISSTNGLETDQMMYASINLYIDNYLANDPSNGLYISPRWSEMYSYMSDTINGEIWMPHVELKLQNIYYGNSPKCTFNYNQDLGSFINSFQACGSLGHLQGGSNDNVDASYIWTGYQNFQGNAYGDSYYTPFGGSEWGVFGYFNPQKNSQAYAGGLNGYWVLAQTASQDVAHEFGHLMGGAHEDGNGATSGPSGMPGHGATTYCIGYWCNIWPYIGYRHSIMWSTGNIINGLFRDWAFSSNSWSGSAGTFTLPSYNSDFNHDNLFYVRGTIWYNCRFA